MVVSGGTMSQGTGETMKRTVLAFSSLLIGLSALFVFVQPAQAAVDQTPDCDTVAIIKCGVTSQADLREKAKTGDIPRVFSAFGINQNQLNGMVEGVVWKDGRVTIGRDQVVARNAMTAGRWNNPTADMKRIPDTDRAYKMSTSHFVDDGQIAYIKMVDGKFKFAVIRTCGNPVSATPVETPKPPKPTYACKDLTKQRVKGTEDTFEFTAKVVADNGAKVVGYRWNFGDGKKKDTTKNTVEHKYAEPGTYTAKVAGIIDIDGKKVEANGASCVVQLTVTKEKVPTYACRYMNLKEIDRAKRIVETDTLASQNKEGVTFKHFVYDFGDGTPAVTTTNPRVQHTFAKDGTFTVRAHAVFTVNGEEKSVTSDACAKQITFSSTQPPVVTPPTPTPTTPEKLVDTGAGAVIGVVFSTMIGGTLAYKLVWLRRFAD